MTTTRLILGLGLIFSLELLAAQYAPMQAAHKTNNLANFLKTQAQTTWPKDSVARAEVLELWTMTYFALDRKKPVYNWAELDSLFVKDLPMDFLAASLRFWSANTNPSPTIPSSLIEACLAKAEQQKLYNELVVLYTTMINNAYNTFNHHGVGQFYDRLALLLESIPNSPEYANSISQTRRSLAYYYFGSKRDFDRCLQQIQELEQAKDSSTIQEMSFMLVDLYEAKGDWERAKYYSDIALLSPAVQPYLKTAQHLFRYRYYREQGRYSQAKQAFKPLNPDSLFRPNYYGSQYLLPRYLEAYLSYTNYAKLSLYPAIEDYLFNSEQPLVSSIGYTMRHPEYSARLELLIKRLEQRLSDPKQFLPVYAKEIQAIGDWRKFQGRGEEALVKYEQALFYLGLDREAKDKVGVLRGISDDHAAFEIYGAMLSIADSLAQAKPGQTPYALEAERYLDYSFYLAERILKTYTSRRSKELLLEKLPALYENALDKLWAKYQKEPKPEYLQAAYELSERSKSVLLSEMVRANSSGFSGDLPDSLYQYGASLQRDIRRYNTEIQRCRLNGLEADEKVFAAYLVEAEEKLKVYEQRLAQDYPRYYKQHYQANFSEMAELQDLAKAHNKYLLSYTLGERSLYIWRIDESGMTWYRRAREADFRSRYERFRYALTNHDYILKQPQSCFKDLSREGRYFYRQLLEAVIPQSPAQAERGLVVIPDGVLHYLPFELLLDKEGQFENYRELPYLLRQYPVAYHYSLSLWAEQKRQALDRAAHAGVLGFSPIYQEGDSSLRRRNLANLEGAKREVKWLQNRYKGQYFFDEAAKEETFKQLAANYSVLHLAMHGLPNLANPAFAALAFSAPSDSLEDGFLHAYEIEQLRLNAELSVLSACETAQGRYQAGEGVMSLGRYFLYAGSASVVLTWWPVNDQAGEWLMKDFYSKLEQGLSKDQALRQAKLGFLENIEDGFAEHPFFWASYQFLGDSRPIKVPADTDFIYTLGLVLILGGLAVGLGYWRWRRQKTA